MPQSLVPAEDHGDDGRELGDLACQVTQLLLQFVMTYNVIHLMLAAPLRELAEHDPNVPLPVPLHYLPGGAGVLPRGQG